MVNHKKAISWLLMFAFLTLVFTPYHYHLHHSDNQLSFGSEHHPNMGDAHSDVLSDKQSGSNPLKHVADIHFDKGILESDDHINGHTIDSDSKILVKIFKLQLPVLALFLIIALLLPFRKIKNRQRLVLFEQEHPCFYPYSSPPLRAPPHS